MALCSMFSMKCSDCGSNMVRRYEEAIYLSNPPKRKLEWWCKCGMTHDIRFEEIPNSQPTWEQEWERINP